MKKLFIAHSTKNSRRVQEVHTLAEELRLRGLIPWVDKLGGFKIGDHSRDEARRAIREDCFGFVLYATPDVFDSEFVREVEMDEARRVKAKRPGFLLFAVPRDLSFKELQEASKATYNLDLSSFHSISLADNGSQSALANIADAILERALAGKKLEKPGDRIRLQFSTRELMPDDEGDLLRIDATASFNEGRCSASNWSRIIRGLQDIKQRIASEFGRPRLVVHGSKHLSAAFLLGRVFAPFDIDIRQTKREYWRSDGEGSGMMPLDISSMIREQGTTAVFLEVRSGRKNVSAAAEAFARKHGLNPRVRLSIGPEAKVNVDNLFCRQLADQTYKALENSLRGIDFAVDRIHIFAAAPQAFMVMLGGRFQGMPPTVLHEWSGKEYRVGLPIQGGVL